MTDPELVASSVAGVLAVADHSTPSVLAALVDYVLDTQILLVLDNCEHVLDGCAVLGQQAARGRSSASDTGHEPPTVAAGR